jgi:hypothetical protein
MDFDERLIERKHVKSAIERYCSEKPKHHAAKSAFLLWNGERLPAKYILRLSFQMATGCLPNAETLTGGRASVRVLKQLGFDTIYEKPKSPGPIKHERRKILKKVLESLYGTVHTEWKSDEIWVPDLTNRDGIDPEVRIVLDAVESHRGRIVKGRKGHRLAFDFYLTELKLPIEFDERQHFTPLRTVSLRNYPQGAQVGFDLQRWIGLSEKIRAGDNDPPYRDLGALRN